MDPTLAFDPDNAEPEFDPFNAEPETPAKSFSSLPDFTSDYGKRLVGQYGGRMEQWADRDIRGRPGVPSKHKSGEAVDYYHAPVVMRQVVDALTKANDVGLVIHNRRQWTPDKGWEPYGGVHPHDDHIHFEPRWMQEAAQQAAATTAPVAAAVDGEGWEKGYASSFGGHDPVEYAARGYWGSPRFGKTDLRPPDGRGVAVPVDLLEKYLGPWSEKTPDVWKGAQAEVLNHDTGQRMTVPIIDVGPGKGMRKKGAVVDLLPGTAKDVGGNGWSNASVRIIRPNAGANPGPAIGAAFDPANAVPETPEAPPPAAEPTTQATAFEEPARDPRWELPPGWNQQPTALKPGMGDMRRLEADAPTDQMPFDSGELAGQGLATLRKGVYTTAAAVADGARALVPPGRQASNPANQERLDSLWKEIDQLSSAPPPPRVPTSQVAALPVAGGTDKLPGLKREASVLSSDNAAALNTTAAELAQEGKDSFSYYGVDPQNQRPIAQAGRAAANVGGMLPYGPLALPQMGAQIYEESYRSALEAGKSDDEARSLAGEAVIAEAPRLGMYVVGGKLVSGGTGKLMPGASPLERGIAGGTAAAGANAAVSAGLRAADGQPIAPTLEQGLQDALWGVVHGAGEAGVRRGEPARAPEQRPEQPPAEAPKAPETPMPPAPTMRGEDVAPQWFGEETKGRVEYEPVGAPQALAKAFYERSRQAGKSGPEDALFERAMTKPDAEITPGMVNNLVEQAQERGIDLSDLVRRKESRRTMEQASEEAAANPSDEATAPGAESIAKTWEEGLPGTDALGELHQDPIVRVMLREALRTGNRNPNLASYKPLREAGLVNEFGEITDKGREVYARSEGHESAADFERQTFQKPNENPPISDPAPAAEVAPAPEAPKPAEPAATPFEGNASSVKNAATDIDRTAHALQPAGEANKRPWPQVQAEARERLTQGEGDGLVSELQGKPREVSDTESAMLAYKWEQSKRRLEAANKAVIDAHDKGGDVSAAMKEREAAEQSAQELAEVLRSVGTKAGQALAARKMFNVEDYELPQMLANYRAKGGGKPLTQEESARVRLLHEKIKEAKAAVEQHEAGKGDRESDDALGAELVRLFKEAEAERPAARASLVRRVADSLKTQAEKARERLEKRRRENGGKLFTGVDPQKLADIADYAIIGAAHIAEGAAKITDFAARMVKEFGDGIRPHLKDIFEASKKRMFEEAESATKAAPKTTLDKLKARVADGGDISRAYVRKLAKEWIQRGTTDRDQLLDVIHNQLQKIKPEMTRREAMDLLSGYGDFKPLPKDDVSVRLRKMTGELQQIAKLQDMEAGEAPKKTGIERRTPSDAERALQKEVEEAKRRGGYKVTDPATQLKTAIAAVKTRIKNEIRDLTEQIDTGKKPPAKSPLAKDQETEILTALRDRLKQTLGEIDEAPGRTDAQKIAAAEKALESTIAEYERQIRTEDTQPRKPTEQAWSPKIAALRARRNALKAEHDELRALQEAVGDTKRGLAAWKARTMRQIEQLHDKLARSDFGPKPKKAQVELDREGLEKRATLERLKKQVSAEMEKHRQADRPIAHKILDSIAKWKRAFVLSGPGVIFKLTTIATETAAVFRPLEEAIGGVVGKVIPGIAKRAPVEGGFSLRAEALAVIRMFQYLWRDLSGAAGGKGRTVKERILGMGRTDFDYAYGKHDGHNEWKEIFGVIHGMLKTPVRRNAFERTMVKMTAHAARNGVDVSDPIVQTNIANRAYLESQRAIFMEPNAAVELYKRGMTALTKPKGGGKPTMTQKVIETAIRGELPVVTIPTNYVGRVFEYVAGTVLGSARAASAYAKGIEKLTPEQADQIMRNLKRGSIGAAFMLVGFYASDNLGGYYDREDKKKKAGGIRPNEAQIGDQRVPRLAMHHPALEAMQYGATLRKRFEHFTHKGDEKAASASLAVLAASLGLVEEAPLMSSLVRNVHQSENLKQFVGEHVRDYVAPQAVQQAARYQDMEPAESWVDYLSPRAKRRKPKTMADYIKTGFPGLRKDVPAR